MFDALIQQYNKNIAAYERKIAELKGRKNPSDHGRIKQMECMLGDMRYAVGCMKRDEERCGHEC